MTRKVLKLTVSVIVDVEDGNDMSDSEIVNTLYYEFESEEQMGYEVVNSHINDFENIKEYQKQF